MWIEIPSIKRGGAQRRGVFLHSLAKFPILTMVP